MKDSHNFLAVEEYRHTVIKGMKQPGLFRNLAVALYKLGFVDDAIVEMEKAVELSPDSDFLLMELGILYMAKDKLEKAREQFLTILKINAGFTNAYYYLGEAFLRAGHYDMAWLSAKMARRLGHKGGDLIKKLGSLSKDPGVNPWVNTGEDLYIRQMLFATYAKARDVMNRLSQGELFEVLASSEDAGTNPTRGGFIGHFNPSEVHPEIARALLKQEVITEPVIIETERGFHIVQRIIPFNFNSWEKLLADYGKSHVGPSRNLQVTKHKNGLTFVLYVGAFKEKKMQYKGSGSCATLAIQVM